MSKNKALLAVFAISFFVAQPIVGTSQDVLRVVKNGELDKLKELVAQGESVAVCDRDGVTPLHLAAFGGDCEVLKYLINLSSEMNVEGRDGSTPLDYALEAERTTKLPLFVPILQLLVDNGARKGRWGKKYYPGRTPEVIIDAYGLD